MPASFVLFKRVALECEFAVNNRGRGHGRALKACANRARLATGPYPVPPWSSAPRPALLALQLSDSILLALASLVGVQNSRWRKKMAQCAHSILSSFSSSPPKPYSEFRRLRTSRASKCELRGRAWKPEGLTDQTLDRCLIGASAANGGRTRARRARSRRSGTLQLKAKRATLAVPPSSPLEHGRQKGQRPRLRDGRRRRGGRDRRRPRARGR